MRMLIGLFFIVLAVVAGVALFVAWEPLGEYYIVLGRIIELPWFTLRAVVAIFAVAMAVRAVTYFRRTPEAPSQG